MLPFEGSIKKYCLVFRLNKATFVQHKNRIALMMKNTTSYCLSFIALLLFSTLLPSCDKDKPTVLTGKIRDKVTGLPIEKALFNVDIVVLGDDGASYVKSEYIFTDKEGSFSYSITETDKEYIGACSVSKPGYIPVPNPSSAGYKRGGVNEYDVMLTPLDGTLNVTFLNKNAALNDLSFVVFNPFYVNEPYFHGTVYLKKNPVKLLANQSYTEALKMPAGILAYLYWGEKWTGSYQNAPYKDSVFIKRNEVTEYLLTY